MRCLNNRWLYLFLIFAFPHISHATPFYWAAHGPNGVSVNANAGPTPEDACRFLSSSRPEGYVFRSANRVSSTRFNCYETTPGDMENYIGYTVRNGSECLPDYTYNDSTGVCEAPPEDECLLKNGQSQSFTKAGTSGDGYGTVSGGFVAGVQSACFGGCAVSTVDQKCVGRVSGAYTCRGTAYYSGQSCATTGISTEIQENTSQLPLPTPQTINDEKPCVYSQDGASQICQSSVNNEKEGQFCGEVNGVKTCVDFKPTKNGIVIDTKVDTETKPDGSKVVTKTDTATKTVCKGANDCTSTTTKTTTTTNIDANGNTTGVSGSCTGEGCPDKNTNPDGDGDGFGDCTGSDCGEEEGGGSNDWYTPGEDTYASVIEDFSSTVSGLPVVAGVDNFLTFTPSGACPVYNADVWVFSVRLDQWCTESLVPWELIKAVILGCCAFFAFRIAFM